MPRFSVIVPVYNVEPWVAQCLDSLLGQSFADWEALCIDDGSTDGSGEIIDLYAARDTRIHTVHQPNGGLSAARNTGLNRASGDYVLFLDSDDYFSPNALQTLANHLHDEDMLCFAGQRFDDATGQCHPIDSLTPATYPTGMAYYNANALLPRDFAFVCVVLRCYRRQFLADHHLCFREGILHEDNLFTPQACLQAKCVSVIPDPLYHYRLRSGSIMTSRSLRSRESLILVANQLATLFLPLPSTDRVVALRAITHHYQAALAGATRTESRTLRPMIDWKLYHAVSRTRLRHRFNYLLLRIVPTLFHLLYR